MTIFFISFLFFFLIIGGFFGAIMWVRDEEKPIGIRLIKTLSIMLAIGIIFGGLFTLDTLGKEEMWNGGKCPSCNVKWDFEGASKSRFGSTTRYYECPQCHDVIEQ
jgi:hypothetical protein